jgi:hypothetical protein
MSFLSATPDVLTEMTVSPLDERFNLLLLKVLESGIQIAVNKMNV